MWELSLLRPAPLHNAIHCFDIELHFAIEGLWNTSGVISIGPFAQSKICNFNDAEWRFWHTFCSCFCTIYYYIGVITELHFNGVFDLPKSAMVRSGG